MLVYIIKKDPLLDDNDDEKKSTVFDQTISKL